MSFTLRNTTPSNLKALQAFANPALAALAAAANTLQPHQMPHPVAVPSTGRFVGLMNLPVDIASIIGQRSTNASVILKLLNEENGFNPGLMRPVSVVRVTEEVGRAWINTLPNTTDEDRDARAYYERSIINGYLYLRWDGDHRRWLYKVLNDDLLIPGTTMPNEYGNLRYDCLVYDVPDVTVANQLFVKIQKTRQKGLSPEELFVNNVLGRDPASMNYAARMTNVGLKIKADDEEVGDKQLGLLVKHRYMLEAFRIADAIAKSQQPTGDSGSDDIISYSFNPDTLVKEVVEMFRRIYPTAIEIPGMFLAGMLQLRMHRPGMFRNGTKIGMMNYLKTEAATKRPKEFISVLARHGGNVHNKEDESFAYGVAVGFGLDPNNFTASMRQVVKIRSLPTDLNL